MSTTEMALAGPEVEVVAKASRRRFTVEYKRKIVREADGGKTPGASGALLRREGLYSSHLSEWRKARDGGTLAGAGPAGRAGRPSREQQEITALTARAERAERELAKTRAALDVVGKAHALLEMLSESADTEPRSKP